MGQPLLKREDGFHVRSLATGSHATRHVETSWRNRYWLYGSGIAFGFVTSTLYLWYTGDGKAKEALNPHDFTSYRLVSREPVSSTSSLFVLRPQSIAGTADIYENAWRKGIWSVQIKQPQLQIARSYTPLPPLDTSDDSNLYDLRFLIRRDPNGELSGYLHKLAPNAEVELRGPQTEYDIPQNVEQVVFLAGGTGIAPALQMVHTLLDHRLPNDPLRPRIHILWANRRAEDAIDRPLVPRRPRKPWASWFGTSSELDVQPTKDPRWCGFAADIKSLKSMHRNRLRIDYYIDEEGAFVDKNALEKCLNIGDAESGSIIEPGGRGRRLLVISGPEGFVNHFAGPKVWRGGKECQGPLGGLLRKLSVSGWEVWKL